jgi:CDP-2,3-bis-(O-geranylgeranyl)-sn-glycerol synthase
MRFDWLAWLKRPIDGGHSWRGRRLFGHSKTWRGPLLVAAGSAGVWWLQRQVLDEIPALAAVVPAALPGAWFGALAGFVAELGELPNSFVKRRLGIGPGATAQGPLAILFYLADQLDVVIGYWLALAWVVPPTPLRLATSLAVGLALHPLLTWLGYLLRMRRTAR